MNDAFSSQPNSFLCFIINILQKDLKVPPKDPFLDVKITATIVYILMDGLLAPIRNHLQAKRLQFV